MKLWVVRDCRDRYSEPVIAVAETEAIAKAIAEKEAGPEWADDGIEIDDFTLVTNAPARNGHYEGRWEWARFMYDAPPTEPWVDVRWVTGKINPKWGVGATSEQAYKDGLAKGLQATPLYTFGGISSNTSTGTHKIFNRVEVHT